MTDVRIQRRLNGDEWQLSLYAADPAEPVQASLSLRWRTGERQPRHWYHLGSVVHAAPELNLFHRQATLLMGNDLTGAIELEALQVSDAGLAPPERQRRLRQLLQAAAIWTAQAVAADPALAQAAGPAGLRLFAELPGPRDEQGQSPFWHGLGQHFFAFTETQAERRFGAAWRREVAALLPRHPLLVSFLPESAQAVLSQPAPSHAALALALQAEGLMPGSHLGLLDGGPVHEGLLGALPAARASAWFTLQPGPAERCQPVWLMSADKTQLQLVQAELAGQDIRLGAALSQSLLQALGAVPGQRLWAAPVCDPAAPSD